MSGRPSTYTPEIADLICQRIADGDSIPAICRDDGMPDRRTIRRWEEQHPDFAAQCERARAHRADAYADRMDDVLAKLEAGTIDPAAARVIISNLEWKASKLNRARYGETTKHEHTGKNGEAIKTQSVTPDLSGLSVEQLAALAGIAAAVAPGAGEPDGDH